MTTQTANFEQELVGIARHLPPERTQQLLEFARFLAFETFKSSDLHFLRKEADTEADEKWETLLGSEEGQHALDRLADEALAAIRTGKATPIIINDDNELAVE